MSKTTVIAILCSDLHLSHKPPLARVGEKCWYEAMARTISQLHLLQDKHKCPIICAGDIFDNWNPPVELVNWAIRTLPKMYAIPGQHDLPYHRYEDIRRSAYWTLVEAGKIVDLIPDIERKGRPMTVPGLNLHAFPWGTELKPYSSATPNRVNLAVVHKYIWVGNHKYPGAPDDAYLDRFNSTLGTYDAVVIGDNHKNFYRELNGISIFNCGTLMRRKSDEAEYRPTVGLLQDNAYIDTYFLDITEDILEVTAAKPTADNALTNAFIESLKEVGVDPLNYKEALKQQIAKQRASVEAAEMIAEALDDA